MNQIKIGKFIAECRKKNNLTQMQLAEKLNITDRAISKWENGKAMPDSSIMLELCNELKISVNELLSGELIEVEKYAKKAEENLVNLKNKNERDRSKLILFISITIAFIIFTQVVLLFTVIQNNNRQLDNIVEVHNRINGIEERINNGTE